MKRILAFLFFFLFALSSTAYSWTIYNIGEPNFIAYTSEARLTEADFANWTGSIGLATNSFTNITVSDTAYIDTERFTRAGGAGDTNLSHNDAPTSGLSFLANGTIRYSASSTDAWQIGSGAISSIKALSGGYMYSTPTGSANIVYASGEDLSSGIGFPGPPFGDEVNIAISNIPTFEVRTSMIAFKFYSGLSGTDFLTADGNGNLSLSAVVGGGTEDYILIRDEKANGVQGGTATLGSFETRDCCTEVYDAGGFVNISSNNQFILSAGTYRFNIRAPGFIVQGNRARLYNITDTALVELGTNEYAPSSSGNMTYSKIIGRFTIASPKVLEIQHQVQITAANNGYGQDTNFGSDVEIYTIAEFWREN